MQSIEHQNIVFKFIILTEQISFIPKNILDRCQVISFSKPTKTNYKKLSNSITENKYNYTNLKNCISLIEDNFDYGDKKIVNVLLEMIIHYKSIDYLVFRESCYDIFIYGLDLNEVIYTIISKLVERQLLKKNKIANVLNNYYHFLKYYNNNYRPIYHLEKFFFELILCLNN